MFDFDKYVSRHGEFGAQALIERLECYEGIRDRALMPLVDRWNAMMALQYLPVRLAA